MGRRSIIGKAQGPAAMAAIPSQFEALDNYVSIQNNTPHTQTQSAVAPVALMAVALQLKYSGIVDVRCNFDFADGTTAKTVQHKLVLVPFVNPGAAATFLAAGTGAVKTGAVFFGNDVGIDTSGAALQAHGAILNSDAAGVPANSMQYAATVVNDLTAGAVVIYDSGAVPTLTGLLTAGAMQFKFSGIACKTPPTGGASKVRFTTSLVGAPAFLVALVELQSTGGGDVVTYQSASMSMQELPLG